MGWFLGVGTYLFESELPLKYDIVAVIISFSVPRSVTYSVGQPESFVTALRYNYTICSGELLDLVMLSHSIFLLNFSILSCTGHVFVETISMSGIV